MDYDYTNDELHNQYPRETARCVECPWEGLVEDTEYDEESDDIVCPDCGAPVETTVDGIGG